MLRHYYTLLKLAESFKELIGWTVEECFTQDKNSIIIRFSSNITNRFLIFHSNPNYACIYLSYEFNKARKNVANIFSELVGEVLQNVHLSENDRVIQFDFIYTRVYITLFGGSRNSFIITDLNNAIIDALNFERDDRGKLFQLETKELKSFIDFPIYIDLFSAISKCDIPLGKHYAEEFIKRYNINLFMKIADLEEEEKQRIHNLLHEFRKLLIDSKKYYILSNNQDEKILSLIPLHNYPNILNEYIDINEAIRRRFVQIVTEKAFNDIKNQVLLSFKRKIKKLEGLIDESKNFDEAFKQAELYKLYADLLISHPESKKKFGQEIQLTDWGGNYIKIPLDEKLNLIDNAAKYYKKSKKLNNEVEFKQKRLPLIEQEFRMLNEQIKYIDNCKNIRELKKYMKSENIADKQENQENLPKFRRFELGSGYTLYVGKSAANNDELTMKFAKPNDYWFHARGFGGSHCVLRQDSKDKPPKDIIIKAAEIAAYYSKGRKAKYVPVAYTQKKYVRKPKGAAQGAVLVDKEEVIMVQPRLPEIGK